MSILEQIDLLRIKVNSELNPKSKSSLGQFFTPAPICLFMASLFEKIKDEVKLLDPGCGPGFLTSAFVDELLKRKTVNSLKIDVFDIETIVKPYITETLNLCANEADRSGVKFDSKIYLEDFILNQSEKSVLLTGENEYTHVIMNPPYKKISTSSNHRKALRSAGIETVNLYTGFVALAIHSLAADGELVAIIPRSFCNGPYYQSFREFMLRETAIKHIHIFESRANAFSDDQVLQENIIIHLIKGVEQCDVTITSSPAADFHFDDKSNSVTATDKTVRKVSFEKIVNPSDKQKFIHIAANERDQSIINRLSHFNTPLEDLGLNVRTLAP